jgi:lysophospholipase L1-like esterase
MLESKHPLTTFSVINAGVNGGAAAGGLARLERDVIRHQPDLVIVGFCLNDSALGRPGLPAYRANIEAIVGQARAKTESDVVLLTPNFMASRDNPKVAAPHREFVASIVGRQNDGTLKAFVAALREAARTLDVPVADVYAQWEAMASEGVDCTARLSNGLNHPDVEGQRLIAATLFALIERAGGLCA